jgi:hypothetical protein
MTEYFATHPIFLLCAAIVAVVLVALTMRSIIRRDHAMIGATDPVREAAAYNKEWRKAA